MSYADLQAENTVLQRTLEELRRDIPKMREENAALRDKVAWQERWIKELREAVAALTEHKPAKV